MNQRRISLIDLAFSKLDSTNDGKIEVNDLKARYDVQNHPDFLNGDRTKDELLQDFLSNFEQGGIIDGVVSLEAISLEIAFKLIRTMLFQ